MKKKFALPSFIVLTSMSLVGTIAGSLAWLSDKANIGTNSKMGGSSEGAYFAYGDGSAADDPDTPVKEGPYGIETARQLYNLAWLQYLGYFNKAKNGVVEQKYFELNADIDMTGWVIPPIGTTRYPFVGNFSGKSIQGYDQETGKPIYSEAHTISNLVTSNTYDQIVDTNKLPGRIKQAGSISDVNIIGMFGVVGNLNDAIPESVTYDTQVNEIKDFYLDNATITSTASNTLIGIVAGYVNGTISGVGVSNSNINEKEWIDKEGEHQPISKVQKIGTLGDVTFNNVSDFGIVGYCEDEYKEQIKTIKSDIYNTVNDKYDYVAQLPDEEIGWGGSIDMKTTYDGLLNVWNTYDGNYGRKYRYPTTKTYAEDIDGNVITNQYGPKDREYRPSNNYSYYSYSQYAGAGETKQSANYTFAHRDNTDRYMYIYGKNSITLDDVVTVNKTTYPEVDGCFYISYGTTHRLTKTGNTAVGDSTTGTSWNINTDNRIYTIENGTNYYYLVAGAGSLSLTSTQASGTVWTWSGSTNTFSCTISGTTYYLFYDNGWTTKTIPETYYTFYSNNYYLGTNGTNITALASVTDKAKWYLDNTGYYQMYNSAKRYLGTNDGSALNFVTTPSYYMEYNTQNSYLRIKNYNRYRAYCNNGTWTIGYNTTETVTRNTVPGGSASDYAIVRDNSAPNFKLRTTTNTDLEDYTFETEDTFFPLKQEEGDKYNSANGSNYLICSYIGNTIAYLKYDANASPTYLTNTFDSEQATKWVVNNNNYISPSERTNYYLNYQNTTNTLRCTNTTTNAYTTNDSRSYILYSSGGYYSTYYIVYFNGTNWGTYQYSDSLTSETAYLTNVKNVTVSGKAPNGVPKETNTGYVIGGANGGQDGSAMQGNIRVSQYFGNGSAYPTSLTDLSVSDNKISIDTLYTIKSDNMSTVAINSSEYSSYQKLAESKKGLEDVLTKDQEWIYGLHFMESEIEYGKTYDAGGEVIEDKSVYAPYAIINTEEKTNYELPKNCIDFNLKEKGYINFIAGAYFGAYKTDGTVSSANNCFFTIKEVQRDTDDSISIIRPIKAIYSDGVGSHSYIYEYAEYDNSTQSTTKQFSKPFKLVGGVKKTFDDKDYVPYSSTKTIETDGEHTYTKVFNVDWISTSASLRYQRATYNNSYYFTGAPYYFELPMNMGEYAMGAPSFNGAQGAYLMYLDIGANAAKINRAAVTEYWKEMESITYYATGVGFVVAAGNTVSDKNSFCVTIKNEYNGLLSFDKISDENIESGVMYGDATYTDSTAASGNVELSYRYGSLKVNKNNKGISEEPAVAVTTTEYKRLTYYDYSPNNDKLFKFVITDKKVGNSWTRVSIEKYEDFDIETNTGTKNDELDIYDHDGYIVEDTGTITFDVTDNKDVLLSFSNYYPGLGTITISSILTVVAVVDDETSYTYYDVTGINFTVKLTRTDGKTIDITSLCKVTSIVNPYGDVTYVYTINGETATDGKEITIHLTVGS